MVRIGERIIQSITFAHGAVSVQWLDRDDVHEDGRSYLAHTLNVTRASHPTTVSRFEGETAKLLDAAIADWLASSTTHRVPDSQTLLRSALHSPITVAAPALTPGERKVMDLLVSGLALKQVAAQRGSAMSTVKAQTARIYAKWGVHSRAGLIVAAIRNGYTVPL